MNVEERVRLLFREVVGGEPEVLVRSPARVNLIGDHTDYNDGLALPVAIDRELWIAARPAPGAVELTSARPGNRIEVDLGLDRHGAPRLEGWGRYVEGVRWALAETGMALRGWRGVIASEIPDGAGLSSSAALELAVARVFAAVSGVDWDPPAMARACRRAENEWVGVASGLLDPLACALARRGEALRIDFRSLEIDRVALPAEVAIVVLDTTTRRTLASSKYNDRHRECQAAAAAFGVDALRDLALSQIEAASGIEDRLLRRARHVVTENARVEATVAALAARDMGAVGQLLDRSHASLRDDFESSGAALDAIVAAARAAPGCVGARVTGGGFAGCAVALVERETLDAFEAALRLDYHAATGLDAVLHACQATAGTERLV